jgi:hypothetical protein
MPGGGMRHEDWLRRARTKKDASQRLEDLKHRIDELQKLANSCEETGHSKIATTLSAHLGWIDSDYDGLLAFVEFQK